MMSSHMALPQEGQLSHLLQVFSFIRKYHNSELVLNASNPVMDTSLFEQKYWISNDFGHINGK